jgi:hypothetical protein
MGKVQRVDDDGSQMMVLTNRMRLKVYSAPLGNPGDIFGDEYAYATECVGRNRIKTFSSNTLPID